MFGISYPSSRIVARLSNAIAGEDGLDGAIKDFVELVGISDTLSSSHCTNLKEHVKTTCENRRNELKDKLSQ